MLSAIVVADDYECAAPAEADLSQVTLRDESGTTLAVASTHGSWASGPGCTLTATLADVPDSATFYALMVGHHGELTFSHADMVASGWHIDAKVGP